MLYIMLFAMRRRINRRRAGDDSHCTVQMLNLIGIVLFSMLDSSAAIAALTPFDPAFPARPIAQDPGPEAIRRAEPAGNYGQTEATDAQAPISDAPTVECKEAVVNPVTGNAECVRPRGAPVDAPPQLAVPCTGQYAAGAKRGCPQSPPKDESSEAH
jgi:hypothetical protein